MSNKTDIKIENSCVDIIMPNYNKDQFIKEAINSIVTQDFKNWKLRWHERLKINNTTPEKYLKLMRSVNPSVIPRNHKVEEVLDAANNSNFKPVIQLIEVLKNPYNKKKGVFEYQVPSTLKEKYQTFCGT